MASIDYAQIFPIELDTYGVRSQYVDLLGIMVSNEFDIKSVIEGIRQSLNWIAMLDDNLTLQQGHLRCLLELLGIDAVNVALYNGVKLPVYNRLCSAINEKFRGAATINPRFFKDNRVLIKRVTKMYTPFD